MVTFRDVELQGEGFCLDIVKGLHEPSAVRGKDSIAPGQDGRYARNRKRDVRRILLEGYIRGVGTSLSERRESFHSTVVAVMAAMDRSLAPGVLSVDGGDYGIPSGEEWTINARCINVMGGPMLSQWTAQEFSIELESVDPEWVIAGS